jgi:hypothetical protein
MKGETEIRGRLNQLLSEELNRRIASATEKLPRRCVHNYRHPLDQRKKVDGESNENYNRITDNRGLPVLQTIGLCMLGSKDPETWGGTICEEPIDAIRCPVFEPSRKKADLLKEFREQLRDESWTRGNLPEVFSLLWLLEEVEAKDQPQIVATQEKIDELAQEAETPPYPLITPPYPVDVIPAPPPVGSPLPVPWWKAWLLRLLGAEPKRLS